jgi:hypothetical protein
LAKHLIFELFFLNSLGEGKEALKRQLFSENFRIFLEKNENSFFSFEDPVQRLEMHGDFK